MILSLRPLCTYLLLTVAVVSALSTLASSSASLRRDTVECDSCNTLVEEFHKQWIGVINEQTKKARAERGAGDKPPAITYNQDIEDWVQGFCKSKEYRKYNADMKYGCQDIMDDHLREIVGKFLHQEMSSDLSKSKGVTDRKREICSEMTHSCPDVDVSKQLSKCGACRALMRDAHYVYRRAHNSRKLESLRIWETLEPLCDEVPFRHTGAQEKAVGNVCDELMSEYDEDLVDLFRGKMSPNDITDAVCNELLGACGNVKEREAEREKERENEQVEVNTRFVDKGVL